MHRVHEDLALVEPNAESLNVHASRDSPSEAVRENPGSLPAGDVNSIIGVVQGNVMRILNFDPEQHLGAGILFVSILDGVINQVPEYS